jgi:hypothetical protein
MTRLTLIFACLLAFTLTTNPQTRWMGFGGGEANLNQSGSCLSDDERQIIISHLKDNRLEVQNPEPRGALFHWPLEPVAELLDASFFNYYGISNYVDHDSGPGLLDYNCGARTYNGHQGTDMFTWPFQWWLYDGDYVHAIAAQSGQILSKFDGQYDQNCSPAGNWNAVYLLHDDGTVGWYGHLKEGSLTQKGIGDNVAAEEYLGVVASSGWSDGSHLHFELYEDQTYTELIDPYGGACNTAQAQSAWIEQRDYETPRINAVLTHDADPILDCPAEFEFPNMQNEFTVGETVYTAFYYSDQQAGQVSNFVIYDPNGSIWDSWDHQSTASYYSSWWYWLWSLPDDGPFGTWQVEAVFEGVIYTHDFQYDGPVSVDDFESADLLFPNPADKVARGTWPNQTTRIKNSMGLRLTDLEVENSQVNLSHLPNGIYYVELAEGHWEKLVIQH